MVAESDHPAPRSTLKLQVHVPAVATIGSRQHLGFRHGTGNPQAVGGPAERDGFHAVERDGSAGQPAIPRPPSWLNPDNSGKAAQRAAVGHLNARFGQAARRKGLGEGRGLAHRAIDGFEYRRTEQDDQPASTSSTSHPNSLNCHSCVVTKGRVVGPRLVAAIPWMCEHNALRTRLRKARYIHR